MGRTLQRYRKLFEELKGKEPQRIYFLYGPEEYIKKEFLGELIKKTLAEGNRAFNLDIFHGDEFDRDGFNDRIASFPLFTDRRMVIVKKFDALSLANKDFVIECAGDLPESLVCVVESIAEKLDSARLKNIEKLAKAGGLAFRFDYLSDEETVERVKGRLHREGLSIEPDALDVLIASVGTHLVDLTNELEKIVRAAGDEKVVTRELVAAVVGKYRTENVFAFLDRLGTNDIGGLVARLNKVIDSGEEPIFVMAMLLRRVLQLMQVQAVLDEQGARARSPRAMGGYLGGTASPFMVGRLIEQVRHFEGGGLDYYLGNLRWADVQLKSTSLPPRGLIETALVASHLRKTLARADELIY
jgi:DNA polymerase-3 subunit delta